MRRRRGDVPARCLVPASRPDDGSPVAVGRAGHSVPGWTGSAGHRSSSEDHAAGHDPARLASPRRSAHRGVRAVPSRMRSADLLPPWPGCPAMPHLRDQPGSSRRVRADRNAAEREQARQRNAAHLEQALDHAAPVDQLWHEAGGGTSGFSPRAFSGLLTSEHWRAVDRCASPACEQLPPHLCWWSAIRASVLELRQQRRPTRPAADASLF
jgi:hypothetical protein